jgi:hypothetical protein
MTAMIAAIPATASAQGRMPHESANGVGADVGIFMPHQEGMSTGPAINGFFEHYLTARDSLRLEVGWANPHNSVDDDSTMRQVDIAGNLIHNWEGGQVHPFVGAGLGVYWLQPRFDGDNVGSHATKFGGSILGGAEFFMSKTFALKGEARYHIVTKSGPYDPSGFALSIGVKSYF